jgi:hypothetical protein
MKQMPRAVKQVKVERRSNLAERMRRAVRLAHDPVFSRLRNTKRPPGTY